MEALNMSGKHPIFPMTPQPHHFSSYGFHHDMTSKDPIFPMTPQPHHFTDYGFDHPHFDHFQFQVLEGTRKNKRETRCVNALHFKQQKPISKEESKKNRRGKWWRNALLFWKWNKRSEDQHQSPPNSRSIGQVYWIEETGSDTPSRSSRPSSRPLAGTLTPRRKGDAETRYLSLNVPSLEPKPWNSTCSMPVYFVT